MTTLLSILKRFNMIDNIVVHNEELRNDSTPVLIEEVRHDSIVVYTEELRYDNTAVLIEII